MHPVRRNILIRWIGYGVVVLATGAWLYMEMDKGIPNPPTANILQRLKPPEIEMPSDEVTRNLQSAIKVFRGEVSSYGSVEKIEPSLLVLEAQTIEEEAQKQFLQVSTVFLGGRDRYAIIGGTVYREGDLIADGRRVKQISQDGVVIIDGTIEETLPWLPPLRVDLKQAERERVARDSAQAAGDEAPTGEQPGAGVDLENLPSDLTPDQALEVLQQMGRQQ